MARNDTVVDNESLRILLIEDNPGDARLIREMFREAAESPNQLVRDGDGRGGEPPVLVHEERLSAGLETLATDAIDVMLLDLNLPDSRGLDTLATVREEAPSVPTIVLTGLADREVGVEALKRGTEEFLVKDEINVSLLVRSVYHAIERRAQERELKRYETLIEESTDVSAILDPDGTIQYITPSVSAVLGYDLDDLVGENAFEYIHADDHEAIAEEFAALVGRSGERHAVEFRFRGADGQWVWLEGRGRNLLEDPMIDGLVVYTRDVTERKRREQLLERQREQLAALNGLNTVVQEITHAVIESSTREEVERLVCEGLAGADSYLGAWTGSVDLENSEVIVREAAAADGAPDEGSLAGALAETRTDPFERVVSTGAVQVVQELADHRDDEPWLAHLFEHGVRSSAAIPIEYEDSLYGILNVYSERPDAFDDVERSIVGRLGDVIGHAINAVERRRALTSDEIVELEFRVTDIFGAMDVPAPKAGRITFERTVPVGDGVFLEYGTVTDDAVDALWALLEGLPHFESLEIFDESAEESRFELRLSAPPAIAAIAAHGGKVQSATIEGGDYTIVAHVPPGSDVHPLVETVQDTYPDAEVLALRQMVRPEGDAKPVESVLNEELTDRQRSVLDAAYFAGFFEAPRDRSGKDIAESLGISASTFHEHIRVGERKLLHALLE